jgi:hypothetical protein
MALFILLWPSLVFGQTHMCTSPRVDPLAIRASLKGVFEIAGKRFHIDPDLAQAITQVESGFNPHAESPKGAQGLMQLMPGTSSALRVVDPFNPHQSIYGGMEYLHLLANDHRFAGNPYMVLVAYNAGPNRTVFPEESYHYADRVTALYHQLKAQRRHSGGLIQPTRSLDRNYLSLPHCDQPTPHLKLVNGMVQASRHYKP